MVRTKVIVGVLVAILSLPIIFGVTQMWIDMNADKYDVTVTITDVKILEDRDYGDAEIFIQVSLDGWNFTRSSLYSGVNDGAVIHLNWTILDDTVIRYTIEVEVKESDYESDDFLGEVKYTRDPPVNASGWHDCTGCIGGHYSTQARVYIIETSYLVEESEEASIHSDPRTPLFVIDESAAKHKKLFSL